MVTLQASDLKINNNEQYNGHYNISLVEDDEEIKSPGLNSEFTQIEEADNCLKLDRTLSTLQCNVDNSSTHCSDVDEDIANIKVIATDNEDDEDEVIYEEEKAFSNVDKWTSEIQHVTPNGQVLPSLDNTTFGEVCITNSSNVRIGNTALYKGPVTIKQFVYTNSNSVNETGGAIANGQLCNGNSNNLSIIKGDGNILPIYQNDKVTKWTCSWMSAAILCILGLILTTVVIVLIVTLKQDSKFTPNFSPVVDSDNHTGVRFIQRYEWGAQPPEFPLHNLTITPVPYVIISHTASEACFTQAECIQRVRLAQTMHIEGNKWSDIGYNFLVGGDGLVYVGRGWDFEGAHTFGYNVKSIGVSLIGTFNKLAPNLRQISTLSKLLDLGVKQGKIQPNYKLLGHRQVAQTLSPGDVLYSIIQGWDHWSEYP